jgi:hypothetical protein
VRLQTVQSILASAMAFQIGITQAASPATAVPVIGIAEAKGSFRVDNVAVNGNATLFDGATVETGRASSSLGLSGGAHVTLGSDSKGMIFSDRLILERGQSRLEKATGFRMEAAGLRILPETGNSTANVVLASNGNSGSARVQVAALTGSLRVLNSRGMVVAKLPQGLALAFEPQASNSEARLTGRVIYKGGHYLITDETTNVTVEVAGKDLQKEIGKRVEVAGLTDPSATPVSDASQFIRITSLKRLPEPGAAAAGSGGASGSSGIALAGTTIAVIGGVAAAAVVGGLAATGYWGQSSTTISR